MVAKIRSSVLNNNSRYVQGGDTIVNEKRLGWWERDITIPRDDITDIIIDITIEYDGRPDLIAERAYGNAKLAWVVLQYNNIVDTIEELTVGKTITIPSQTRLFYSIMTKS
jgi:hypothetical protein